MRSRESLQTDVGIIIAGPVVIAIAFQRLGNNIEYLPSDPRGQPGFDVAVIAIAVVLGVFLITFGTIRLVQGLRDRRE
jgi:hypothetical protein